MEAVNATHQLARGREFYRMRRYDLAIAAAIDAIAATPSEVRPYVLLASSYERLGRLREAEAAAKRAIGIDPGFPGVYTTLGLVRLGQRRYMDALDQFREAIRLSPDYDDAYRLAGHAYLVQERYREGLAMVDRALELDSESITALEVRALLLRGAKRKAEADSTVAHLLELDPQNVLGLREEGLARLERGKRREALAPLREAVRLEPENASIRATYERVVVRTSLAKYLTFLSYLSIVALVATLEFFTGARDAASYIVIYCGVCLIRRSLMVEVLRRDEIARTFVGRVELAENRLSVLAACVAIACTMSGAIDHAHSLWFFGAAFLAAVFAWRGGGGAVMHPKHRLTYHRAGIAFGALAIIGALALVVAHDDPLLDLGLERTLSVMLIAGVIVAGNADPPGFTAFLRALLPGRRYR